MVFIPIIGLTIHSHNSRRAEDLGFPGKNRMDPIYWESVDYLLVPIEEEIVNGVRHTRPSHVGESWASQTDLDLAADSHHDLMQSRAGMNTAIPPTI